MDAFHASAALVATVGHGPAWTGQRDLAIAVLDINFRDLVDDFISQRDGSHWRTPVLACCYNCAGIRAGATIDAPDGLPLGNGGRADGAQPSDAKGKRNVCAGKLIAQGG